MMTLPEISIGSAAAESRQLEVDSRESRKPAQRHDEVSHTYRSG